MISLLSRQQRVGNGSGFRITPLPPVQVIRPKQKVDSPGNPVLLIYLSSTHAVEDAYLVLLLLEQN